MSTSVFRGDYHGGCGREYGAIPAVRIEYRKTEQLWCSKSEKQAKKSRLE